MRDLTLNRLRDSEKSKILRDLNTTLEAGFAIILARDAVLRKKMVFGIEMTEFRDVVLSWKRDQTPPPPAPPSTLPDPVPTTRVLPRRGPDTSTLWKIIYNMQSRYDICVVPEEEVAYERWLPTRGSSVVIIGGPH